MKIFSVAIFELLTHAILIQSFEHRTNTSFCFTGNITTESLNLLENVTIKYTTEAIIQTNEANITCFSTFEDAVVILDYNIVKLANSSKAIFLIFLTKRLGEAGIKCNCQNQDTKDTQSILNIVIGKKTTVADILFRVFLTAFIITITFFVGCNTEVTGVILELKKPISLIISMAVQYVALPLLAFGISKILFSNNKFGLGLLFVSCSPGGGNSNIWTILLRGDLNLCATVTLVNTILSLLMIPLWIFFLGRYYLDIELISLSYGFIASNIIQISFPVVIGIFIRWKWADVAFKILRAIKVLSLTFVLFLLTIGIYANQHFFMPIFDCPYLIAWAALLLSLSFLISFLLGIISKQGFTRSLTISIEVAVPNLGISILLVQNSLPKYSGDIVTAVPFVISLMTVILFLFAYICWILYYKLERKTWKSCDNISGINVQSNIIYRPVFLLNELKPKGKESTVEPTLYYTEEPSEYLESTSEDPN